MPRLIAYRTTLWVSLAPWTTLAACVGLALSDGILSAITPGYSYVGDTGSQLMSPDARYSTLARFVLGIYAVLLIPFAITLRSRFTNRPAAALAIAAIWVHIGSALVAALALNDSSSTLVGGITANEVHDNAATAMFAAALAVLVGAAFGYQRSAASLRLATFAIIAFLLILGPLFLLQLWPQADGIVERILAGSFMAWLAFAAWQWRSDASPASA